MCHDSSSIALKSSSSGQIIVTLDGEVLDFDSELMIPGLVLPNNALSKTQLSMLTRCLKLLPGTFHRSIHIHTRHLKLSDEDVKVLGLICDHPFLIECAIHLEYFVYLRQHGIYLSETMTKQSLSDFHYYWDQGAFTIVPFIVEISMTGSSPIENFEDWVCHMSINPYSMENVYLLVQKYPNMVINYDAILRMFLCLTQDEQETIINYYTFDQIMAIMGSSWYLDDALLKNLHLNRIKANTPVVRSSFVIRYSSKRKVYNTKISIMAMTLDEADDFQSILDRTEFAIPESIDTTPEETFGVLFYYYLKLGSTDFEELVQYIQNCEHSEKETLIKTLLHNSSETKKSIIDVSKQNRELPLSLRLVLSELDWDSSSFSQRRRISTVLKANSYE